VGAAEERGGGGQRGAKVVVVVVVVVIADVGVSSLWRCTSVHFWTMHSHDALLKSAC